MTAIVTDPRHTVTVEDDQISVTSVGVAGPAGSDGTGAYSAAYGHLEENDQSNVLAIAVADTWYPWTTGTASGNEYRFTVSGGALVAASDAGGLYEVTAQLSYSGLNNATTHLCVYKNGAETNLRAERKLGTGGDVGSASIVGLLSLTASDTLTLAVKTLTATGNITIHHFHLVARRVGEHEYLGSEQFDAIQFDTTAGITDTDEGLLYWNADDHTLNLNVNGGPVLQVGQEFLIYCVNRTGGTISDGTAVYLLGSSGTRLEIGVADASDANKDHVLGVATQDILNNQSGFVTCHGLVRGIDASGGGEAWADGQELYLSASTPGALTDTKPASPNRCAVVATVVNNHATTGQIFIHVHRSPILNEVSDVEISGVADGEVLTYSSANSRWENAAAGGGGESYYGHPAYPDSKAAIVNSGSPYTETCEFTADSATADLAKWSVVNKGTENWEIEVHDGGMILWNNSANSAALGGGAEQTCSIAGEFCFDFLLTLDFTPSGSKQQFSDYNACFVGVSDGTQGHGVGIQACAGNYVPCEGHYNMAGDFTSTGITGTTIQLYGHYVMIRLARDGSFLFGQVCAGGEMGWFNNQYKSGRNSDLTAWDDVFTVSEANTITKIHFGPGHNAAAGAYAGAKLYCVRRY